MALPSDTQGADSRLQVRFYKKSVQQEQESIDAGRPIFKDFDFVQICVAGDTLTEIDTYALQNHKQRFPIQWANYMNRQGAHDEELVGTPVAEWPLVSKSQAEELRAIKFQTVESIANASDQQGADSRLQVRFYKKSVQQEQESRLLLKFRLNLPTRCLHCHLVS